MGTMSAQPPHPFPQRTGPPPLPVSTHASTNGNTNTSSSPPSSPKTAPAEKREDCRDYLRTGRCKYGPSCKYNHPPNVQSGGGMKAPLNPSEPLFPVRPNEPVCQYYMKHGTCKFGQACKFHHPPQSQMNMSLPIAGEGGMSGTGRSGDPMQWNGTGNNVHLLPQRPDEPNCIYFLKNGRCKYGATCRYHHPLNYHQDRRTGGGGDDLRRQGIQLQHVGGAGEAGGPQIHYVTSLPPGSYHQGHFVVSDGTVTFLSLDGAPSQVISIPQGSKDTVVYTSAPQRPLINSRDVTSSSSSASIASSFETASSNFEVMGNHGNDSSSSLWGRPKRSASGGSLAAYSLQQQQQQQQDTGSRQHKMQGGRTVLIQNMNDQGMNLPRVASTSSSTSENGTVYYESSQGSGHARHVQSGSQGQLHGGGAIWRNRRSNSFDHVGNAGGYHGRGESDMYEQASQPLHEGQRPNISRGRQPPSSGRRRVQQQPREVDEGLSMMTSALLTMLDTPEEVAAEDQDDFDYYPGDPMPQGIHNDYPGHPGNSYPSNGINQRSRSSSYPSATNMYDQNQHSANFSDQNQGTGGYQDQHQNQYNYVDSNYVDDQVLGLSIPNQRNRMQSRYTHDDQLQKMPDRPNQDYSSWQEHLPMGNSYHGSPQSLSMMQSQSDNNPNHNASNVGLYLP